MGLPAVVAIPLFGAVIWGISSSAKKKKQLAAKRRKYGITFNSDCTTATIWDTEQAVDIRTGVMVAGAGIGVVDSETVMLAWFDLVDASGCLAKGKFNEESAAIYVRFWDSTLDSLYAMGYLDDAQFEAQSQEIWGFMADFDLDEDEVDAADIRVKG